MFSVLIFFALKKQSNRCWKPRKIRNVYAKVIKFPPNACCAKNSSANNVRTMIITSKLIVEKWYPSFILMEWSGFAKGQEKTKPLISTSTTSWLTTKRANNILIIQPLTGLINWPLRRLLEISWESKTDYSLKIILSSII